MAMRPALLSMNALAVEFSISLRTMAKTLRDVEPDGRRGRHPAWRISTAAAALAKRRESWPQGSGGNWAAGSAPVTAYVNGTAHNSDDGYDAARRELEAWLR